MKPLQSIAMGLVIILLVAPAEGFHGYDLLPDYVGWLLVLLGVRDLDLPAEAKKSLLALAGVALVIAAVFWFPAVTDALLERTATESSAIDWARNLPALLSQALLCHLLAARARESGDRRAGGWLAIARTAYLLLAALPVLVFGAGWAALESSLYIGTGLLTLSLIVLLFTYASRPWASVVNRTTPDASAT